MELVNGELAVSVQRGERANTPWVISIVDAKAMPIARYVCKSTAKPEHTIRAAIGSEQVKVHVDLQKVSSARARIVQNG